MDEVKDVDSIYKPPAHDRESFSCITFKEILDNPVEQEWLIEGLIMKGDATLIHAPGGVGKSMLGLYIALHLAAHGMDPGNPLNMIFGRFPVPKPRATLFIQAENSIAAMYQRIQAMTTGNPTLKSGVTRVFILSQYQDTTITGKRFSDPEFCAFVVEFIKDIEKGEINIDLLIIDPLISFLDGNENDSVETRATLDGISRIASQAKCTPVVIHHANKTGKEYRGSTAINDWTRNRISLKQEEGTKPDTKQKSSSLIPKLKKTKLIKVTHEKCNNFEFFESFLLEMGSDLIFRLVGKQLSEKDLETCQKVVQVLENMGGHAESKNALAKAFTASFRGSEKTAKRNIEKAEKACFICKESTTKDGKPTNEYSLPER
jgi:RecA-family ATPase